MAQDLYNADKVTYYYYRGNNIFYF